MSPAAPKVAPIRVLPRSPSSARPEAAVSSTTARHARGRSVTSIRTISLLRSSPPHNGGRRSMLKQGYLRDGAAIYERSFAIIRAEADLSRFTPEEADIAVRMIHAAGQVEIAVLIEFAPGFVAAARAALK